MKINDVIKEASEDSGDYQQMLAFAKANRVGGVPDEQQIPLALFKELKKQQQQNQALSSELSDAEKRINQAMASGELGRQELGLTRGELDRERAAGEKQQAAVGQLSQQYAEREKASAEQIQQLSAQLEQVKNKPGVDAKAAEELERQIKELGEKSVPADRVQELESTIVAIQTMQQVDDSSIKDLISQVKDAQEATKEVEKTKQSIQQDLKQTVQDTHNQVEQIKQDLAKLQQVEKTVATLQPLVKSVVIPQVDRLMQDKALRDKIAMQQSAKGFAQAIKTGALPSGTPAQMTATNDPQASLPGLSQEPDDMQASLPGFQDPANQPEYQMRAVAESAFQRSIAWATGKQP